MLLGAVAAIGWPVAARADLTAGRDGAVGARRMDTHQTAASLNDPFSTRTGVSLEQTVLARLTPWSSTQSINKDPLAQERLDHNIVTVPPGPSSMSLFLSALAGVGAWQLGRNAHKLHVGFLPEWYHAGGPSQVGVATPIDLSFSLTALPICIFKDCLPAGKTALSPAVYRRWSEPASRIPAGAFTLPTDPRGPPKLA